MKNTFMLLAVCSLLLFLPSSSPKEKHVSHFDSSFVYEHSCQEVQDSLMNHIRPLRFRVFELENQQKNFIEQIRDLRTSLMISGQLNQQLQIRLDHCTSIGNDIKVNQKPKRIE